MERQRPEPIPIVLLRPEWVDARVFSTLSEDRRFELLVADALTPEWIALVHKATALVVATEEPPASVLADMLSKRIRTPIVLATAARVNRSLLERAGALACLHMPVRRAEVNRLFVLLEGRAGALRVDGLLRLVFDPLGLVVRLRERSVHLSQREFALLYALSSNSGHPVTAEELIARVWGRSLADEKARQMLEVYVFQIRRKLERLGLRGVVCTIRGVGYALVEVRTGAVDTRPIIEVR